MVGKLSCLLLVLSSYCFGQSGVAGTSVYFPVFTNATSTMATSAIVPNIGQVGHQVFLNFSDAGTHTCTDAGNSVVGGLQFSYDQIRWIGFGTPDIGAVKSTALTYSGVGAYPFVRVRVVTFDTTDCVMNGWYTASSSNSVLTSSTGIAGTAAYDAETGISYLPFTLVGGLFSKTVAPIQVCRVYATGTYTAGTALVATVGPGVQEGICSIIATSAGTATFKIIQGDGATCGSGTIDVTPAFNLIAGVPLTAGGGLGLIGIPYSFSTTVNNNLCVVVTGASVALQMGMTGL